MNDEAIKTATDSVNSIDWLGDILDVFSEMIDEFENGRPVCKMCYSLNNEHMKTLLSARKNYSPNRGIDESPSMPLLNKGK